MDYYQGVVLNYLRADRAIFINAECCIQLIFKPTIPTTVVRTGIVTRWPATFGSGGIFLCEISYSSQLADLVKRLRQWHENWQGVCHALARDSHVPPDWPVRPWLFVPEGRIKRLVKHLEIIGTAGSFTPRITTLEAVQPWRYPSWDLTEEEAKPDCIPLPMRG